MNMFLCLLKRQWKKSILLVLFFCLLLLGQTRTDAQFTQKYIPYQAAYMEKLDLEDRDSFFVQLNNDVLATKQVVAAIESFAGYDGKIPDGALDTMEILTGSSSYMDYNMAVWRETLLYAPGRLSKSVYDDAAMSWMLLSRLRNQENIESILENNKEIMRRGIRRGGINKEKYKTALTQLQNVDTDFAVADTFYAETFLMYLESDWYILALLAMSMFSVFSHGNQYKISNLVLTSKTGMRRYAYKQILSSFLIMEICLALYYSGVIFVLTAGDIRHIPWQHPIQVIQSYENILLDISVFDYTLLNLALKNAFCISFVSMILYISAMSRNNVIALIGTFILCGGLILLNSLIPAAGGLPIGNGRFLLEELCFFHINGLLIPYSTVFAGCSILLALIVVSILILKVPHAARRWVK